MNTHYSNGRSGYAAKTTIALPNLGAGMALVVSTYKDNRGMLVTQASAHVISVMNGKEFMTFRLYTDYSKPVLREKVRVTEKAVRDQHARALILLWLEPTVLDDVRTHYAATISVAQALAVAHAVNDAPHTAY